MKLQNLFAATASVCLLAVFVFGSAHAQEDPVTQFCEEIQMIAEDVLAELEESALEAVQCLDRVTPCLASAANCVSDFRRCVKREIRQSNKICKEFLNGFSGAYKVSAKLDADLNSPEAQECINGTDIELVIAVCAGLPE
jgi:hypothetical protein